MDTSTRKDTTSKREDLKNKPLVEAILELKWVLPTQPTSEIEVDPHYRLLLGRFSERIQGDYPFHEPLSTAQIPDMMAAHMVQHRFRTSEGGWPLIQVGPGLLTVNETQGYTWGGFKGHCEKSVRSLVDAHPAKQTFKVQDLNLRYINAVDVDFSKESAFQFLRDKMKIGLTLPDSLFDGGKVINNPDKFNWQVSFPQDVPGGYVALRFARGKYKEKPAMIWEISVQAASDHIPNIPDGFSDWLKKAHDITDDWFFKLIEGELEGRFSREG